MIIKDKARIVESILIFLITLANIQVDNDLDFNDSGHNVYDNNDILFDCNMTEGIETGKHSKQQDEETSKSDGSSNATSEE